MKVRCPTCGKEADWQENPSRPFCSDRCKEIDLGHWANEDYAVAAEPVSAYSPSIEGSGADGAGGGLPEDESH